MHMSCACLAIFVLAGILIVCYAVAVSVAIAVVVIPEVGIAVVVISVAGAAIVVRQLGFLALETSVRDVALVLRGVEEVVIEERPRCLRPVAVLGVAIAVVAIFFTGAAIIVPRLGVLAVENAARGAALVLRGVEEAVIDDRPRCLRPVAVLGVAIIIL